MRTLFFFKTIRFTHIPVHVAFSVSKYYLRFHFRAFFRPDTFSSFPNLKEMSPSLSNINNATAQQRGPKQNRSEILFTLVEERPRKSKSRAFLVSPRRSSALFMEPHFHATKERTSLQFSTQQQIAHTQKSVIRTLSHTRRTPTFAWRHGHRRHLCLVQSKASSEGWQNLSTEAEKSH